jgi:NADH:ubiquinone oxidoreductase subunit B-like Fe-S oxidoreductase
MAKELNEDTSFKMSIKTMGMIAVGIAALVGGWYSIMAEIQEAKEKPVPVDVTIIKEEILKEIPEAEITRMEFDMKDQMIRQTILRKDRR